MGKRAGEVRLVGQAGCRSNVGGGHTAREKIFGAPQAHSHEHLMRGDVKVQFELALKMPGLSTATRASSSSVTGCM